ncbi:Flp pilus assembly protein, secretin CpaC [Rhodospirillales bacterium URHD0017]|nr:Flp pilus assembly protein, secretin CpaC [Rhodospirillales bacterium URHD0017]
MTPSFAPILPSAWRRAGSSAALVASLLFAFQPSLLLAQVQMSDPDRVVQTKPKAPPPAKKASRKTATDNVSDDLNRREAERAESVVRSLGAPAAAPAAAAIATPAAIAPAVKDASITPLDTLPPTVAAIPPRAAITKAALTPGVDLGQPDLVTPPPAAVPPTIVEQPQPAVPPTPKFAQAPTPAPAPVPIQPPAAGAPNQPAVTGGAPGRPFAQSQIVPTEPPTLTLEVNKGTALKLPGPASTVFVAAPDIADVQVRSPTMVYVFAKKPGDTVLYAVDGQDRVLLNTIVRVTSPLSRVKGALDAMHPNNGVNFDNQGETIVLTGTVRSGVVAEDARRLAMQQVAGNPAKVISNIRVDGPTQVQLRVKVAEVKRDALKRVGINWQNINNIALFGTGNFLAGFAVRTTSQIGGAVSTGALQFATRDGSLNTVVDFLATQNQATILAEPNLIAMSGETASFLAGGEVPLLVPQSGAAAGTVTIQYKQVGVSLAFTPTIIGERINLRVAPEVSELSAVGSISVPLGTGTVNIPGIRTRRAATTIELGSGQSFAVAGLLQSTSSQDINKFPWLGDIPVLGSLFKSDAYQRSETELVIIITPYFVEPTSNKLQTPLTARVPPTDVDRLLMQRYNHPTPPRRLSVGRETAPVGPTAGFKLD